MIYTEITTSTSPRVVQSIRGTTSRAEIEQGIAEALALIEQLLTHHSSFDLLLDLRTVHFADLQAHKTWRVGFLAHPLIAHHARRAAIIGTDTPNFRVEQQSLETANCRFFTDIEAGQAWLETAAVP